MSLLDSLLGTAMKSNLRKGQLNRHTRYQPATTTRNTVTQWSRLCVENEIQPPCSCTGPLHSSSCPPTMPPEPSPYEAAAFSTISASSPFWYISISRSQPPTNSPSM